MKKIERIRDHIICGLMSLVAIMLMATAVQSCAHRSTQPSPKEATEPDTIVSEGPFLSVKDAVEWQREEQEWEFFRSKFLTMEPEALVNVASVLIKRNGCTSVPEVVLEYTRNADIYASLPKQTPQTSLLNSRDSVQDPPDDKIIELQRKEHDTIIDGKVYREVSYNEKE